MALFDEQNDEEREPEEQKSGKYLGLIIFACTLPALLFFTYIGRTDLGLNIGICLSMNVVAVGMCWDLRRRWWFWAVIALVLALHVPLVLLIQWPPNIWVSKFTLLPIGLADLLVTVGVVRFVQKFIVKFVPPDEEE
jgi:hypothetical protein